MIRNARILVAVLILGLVIGAGGWLMSSRASDAQDGPVAVGAVATEWATKYEPDPFDADRLRRSTVSVSQVAVVYSDGHTEVRQVGK